MTELVWHGKHLPNSDPTSEQPDPMISRLHTRERHPPTPENGVAIQTLSDPLWENRLIHADKQALLPLLLQEFSNTVNLIYIDPPFMTGRTFNHRQNGQLAYRDTWKNNLDHYLQWLYETFVLLHQLLAPDGSLYVHLDWRTSHYAKLLLDEIFSTRSSTKGAGFKNEIIWHYRSGGHSKKYYARKHDTILLYTKSDSYCFHGGRLGERRGAERRNHMRKEIGEDGRTFWTIRSGKRVYRYDEDHQMSLPDVWSDISHLHQRDPERTGYATQKPEALLERILLASSNENDLILDCFCGSGVTPIVAERLSRRWIASDWSEQAISTSRARLMQQRLQRPFLFQLLETRTKA
jgi:site-specific DNA-methyltransferase (adenine-specific)